MNVLVFPFETELLESGACGFLPTARDLDVGTVIDRRSASSMLARVTN